MQNNKIAGYKLSGQIISREKNKINANNINNSLTFDTKISNSIYETNKAQQFSGQIVRKNENKKFKINDLKCKDKQYDNKFNTENILNKNKK